MNLLNTLIAGLFAGLCITQPAIAAPSVDGIHSFTYECAHKPHIGFTCEINTTITGGPYMVLTRTQRLKGNALKLQVAAIAKMKADYAAQGGPWIIFRDATGQYPAKLCALSESADGLAYYQCGYGDPASSASNHKG